jgi:hypothetical protein
VLQEQLADLAGDGEAPLLHADQGALGLLFGGRAVLVLAGDLGRAALVGLAADFAVFLTTLEVFATSRFPINRPSPPRPTTSADASSPGISTPLRGTRTRQRLRLLICGRLLTIQ